MNLGPMEIGLLLLVMVFAFGPKRIPEIGKSVGEALAGFRKATKEEDKPAKLADGE
jgi:sec-independent protein translocase protein TatA